jgi:hypothetical protein
LAPLDFVPNQGNAASLSDLKVFRKKQLQPIKKVKPSMVNMVNSKGGN